MVRGGKGGSQRGGGVCVWGGGGGVGRGRWKEEGRKETVFWGRTSSVSILCEHLMCLNPTEMGIWYVLKAKSDF